MSYHNVDEIWRLYRREWVIVQTISQLALDSDGVVALAHAWCDVNLTGRVDAADVSLDLKTDGTGVFWCHVMVFKENLKGEFKHMGQAEKYAATNGYDEYTIVPRNSQADHEIRSIGVRQL